MAELRRDNDLLRQRLQEEDLRDPSDAKARLEVRDGAEMELLARSRDGAASAGPRWGCWRVYDVGRHSGWLSDVLCQTSCGHIPTVPWRRGAKLRAALRAPALPPLLQDLQDRLKVMRLDAELAATEARAKDEKIADMDFK
jgi:hypothetical protein